MRTRRLAGLLLTAVLLTAAAPAPELFHELRMTPLSAAPPALALVRLEDGGTVRLEQLRGRPVLVYFWASW